MSAVIQDRVGSITRNTAGEVDIKLFVYKNRKKKLRETYKNLLTNKKRKKPTNTFWKL